VERGAFAGGGVEPDVATQVALGQEFDAVIGDYNCVDFPASTANWFSLKKVKQGRTGGRDSSCREELPGLLVSVWRRGQTSLRETGSSGDSFAGRGAHGIHVPLSGLRAVDTDAAP
jgi:hypothetical protein